jgi:RimJ/RimL family protein N-acetyltransferase
MTTLPRERITGDGVTLRPPAESDADDVALACDDPVTARFLVRMPTPYTRDDALTWLRGRSAELWDGGGASMIIADPGTDRLIGSIALSRPSPDGYATSIGYWVAPWARGRGVATAAARALAGWAFSHGFGRIELTTDLENEASMRVALGAGFMHEGVRRKAHPTRDGGRTDIVVWTRLASDPGTPTPRSLPDLPAGGLSDGVITVRRLAPSDAEDLYRLRMLPEVRASSVGTPEPTLESSAQRCGRTGYLWLLGARAEMSIRDAATDAFAGDIGMFPEPVTGQAMIGYSVSPEYRGRGFAPRAARMVADWAFDHCGVARMVAGTHAGNTASQRVLEKAGFRRESLERSRLPGADGGPRSDNVGYALLPTDR